MLKQINTSDQNLQLIQDNVDKALSPLQAGAYANAALLSSVSLTSGQDNLVPHGQNKQLQFWTLAGLNVNTAVWSPTSTQLGGLSSTAQYLNLRCGTSCTVSLVVG